MTTRKLLPTKRIYGYVRVSTSGQNPDRQVYNIHEWVKENYGADFVTVDKVSGATSADERDGLSYILDRIQPHDVLITPTVERLGRDSKHVTEVRDMLEERKVIVIYSDELPLLSTLATESGEYPPESSLEANLTHKLISGVIFDILARVAAYEYENSRKRQRQGIERAKARGAYKKPKSLTKDKLEDARRKIEMGIPKAEVARQLKISRATLRRYLDGISVPDE